MRVEVSDHFPDIQAKNILITTRGWCSGNRISCIGCVCKTSKERKEERSGELELSTGCHARARSCDVDVTTILMDIDDENVLTEFEEAEVRDPIPCKVDGDRGIYTSRQMRVRGSAGRPVLCDFGEARIGDGKFTEDIQPFYTAHQRSYCESHGIKRRIFGTWEYW